MKALVERASKAIRAMRVLVVEDDPDILRVTAMCLARVGGMEVLEARNGAEGLAIAAAERPDGILLDLMMPGMDGAQTLAALRARPETARIPVVFLTAKTSAAETERLERLGAAGVLPKPFDPASLVGRVRAILGGA